jgi:hypothetical protein
VAENTVYTRVKISLGMLIGIRYQQLLTQLNRNITHKQAPRRASRTVPSTSPSLFETRFLISLSPQQIFRISVPKIKIYVQKKEEIERTTVCDAFSEVLCKIVLPLVSCWWVRCV